MFKNKLSICMPTYNRAFLLEKTLLQTISQIIQEGLISKVEVCISDNHSTDDTQKVVSNLQAGRVNIKYHQQPENLGFSQNLHSAILMAQGEYILLQGDDDLLKDGALKVIMAAIDTQKNIIIFNSLSSRQITSETLNAANLSPITIKDGVYANEFLGVFHLSFIGNILLRNKYYRESYTPKFLLSAYPHTAILLTALKTTESIFINQAIFDCDDSYRNHNQPLLTSVDMARVQTECLLCNAKSKKNIYQTYRHLVKSIPRAILKQRKGISIEDKNNPYASLEIKNILECYRCSLKYQIIATVLWGLGWVLPITLLERILQK